MDRRSFLKRMAGTIMAAPLVAGSLGDAARAEAAASVANGAGYPLMPRAVLPENVLDAADVSWPSTTLAARALSFSDLDGQEPDDDWNEDEEAWGDADEEPTSFAGRMLRDMTRREEFDWDSDAIKATLHTGGYQPEVSQVWEAVYYPKDRRTILDHSLTLDGAPAVMPTERLRGGYWRYPVDVDPADLNTITLSQPIDLRLHPDAHVVITLHTDKGDLPLVARLAQDFPRH